MINVQNLQWKIENVKDISKYKTIEQINKVFKNYKKMLDNNQLLRFTTAGSVDDGKSTLIGRLLYDSKSIFEDQLEAIENTSKKERS